MARRSDAAGEIKEVDEPPTVDVWHWRDYDVMAHQVKSADQDGRRNMLAAWHLDAKTLVQLGHAVTEQVTPFKHRKLAYAAEWKEYALDRSMGRPAADIYLVDPADGRRTKVKAKLTEDRHLQPSPGGRYLLYLEKRSLLDHRCRHQSGRQHHEEHQRPPSPIRSPMSPSRRSRRSVLPDGPKMTPK